MGSKKLINIGFRIDLDENQRLDQLVERVRERNPYMDKSKVIRELIGFDPAHFVKDEDRTFLRGARSTDRAPESRRLSLTEKGTKDGGSSKKRRGRRGA
jgi:hypothetical protein